MDEQQMIAIVGDFAQRYFSRILGKEGSDLEAELVDESGEIKEEYAQKLQEIVPTLGEEFWQSYEQNPDSAVDEVVAAEQEMQAYRKGGKLNYLTMLKKGGKAKRKCSCGCDLIAVKDKGGKISEVCSCKCGGKVKKVSKKADGGKLSPSMASSCSYGCGWNTPWWNVSDQLWKNHMDSKKTNPLSQAVEDSKTRYNKKAADNVAKIPSVYKPVATPITTKPAGIQPNVQESVVDYMNSQGLDSSIANRQNLYAKYNITGANSAEKNIKLLNYLRNNKDSRLSGELNIAKPSMAQPITVVQKPMINPINPISPERIEELKRWKATRGF